MEFGVRTYAKCKWPLLFKLKKLMPKLTQSPPRFCCIKLLVQSVVQETYCPGKVLSVKELSVKSIIFQKYHHQWPRLEQEHGSSQRPWLCGRQLAPRQTDPLRPQWAVEGESFWEESPSNSSEASSSVSGRPVTIPPAGRAGMVSVLSYISVNSEWHGQCVFSYILSKFLALLNHEWHGMVSAFS